VAPPLLPRDPNDRQRSAKVREWASTAAEAALLSACVEGALARGHAATGLDLSPTRSSRGSASGKVSAAPASPPCADPTVDPCAVYLTGISMGGLGAFLLAARWRPDPPTASRSAPLSAVPPEGAGGGEGSVGAAPPPRRFFRGFAAVAPVCGGGRPLFAPLAAARCARWWFFHAANDVAVTCADTEALARAVRTAMGNAGGGARSDGVADCAADGVVADDTAEGGSEQTPPPPQGYQAAEPPRGSVVGDAAVGDAASGEVQFEVRCTVYPTAPAPATAGCAWMDGHASWRLAYDDPQLWAWLAASRLG